MLLVCRYGTCYARRITQTMLGLLCGTTLLAAPVGSIHAQTLGPELVQQLTLLNQEKAQRTPAQKKLDSQLIFAMKQRLNDPWMSAMTRLRVDVEVRSDGATLVDLTGSINPGLEQAIRALGGSVLSSHPQFDALRAWVPVAALESLASRADVRWIERASLLTTDQDMEVTSQGDAAHSAAISRTSFQVDGTGVKICAISDGVEMLRFLQETRELPSVDVLPALNDQTTTGSEGTALLEIIHDLAPGAALGFAPGKGGSQASFAAQIMALRFQAGCDVIVDDISVDRAPAFGGGPIAQAVARVTDSGAVYVTSAGNSGGLERGFFRDPVLGIVPVRPAGSASVWEGDFRPVQVSTPQGPRLRNDFGGGVTANRVLRDPTTSFVLQWSDPPTAQALNDYDLILINSNQTMIVANSNGLPHEVIDSRTANHTNAVLIIQRASGVDRFLRLQAFDDGILQLGTVGAIFGHKGMPAAIAVGAADASMLTTQVEPDSSDGPRRLFFRPDGSPIAPGNVSSTGGTLVAKPDVVGADGVATRTMNNPDAPVIGPFFGTSAAAPHVAAIAGLVLAAAPPSIDRNQLGRRMAEILRGTAAPLAMGGPFDTGAGAANAFAAVNVSASGLVCGDGLDNDGDTLADALDPGCAGITGLTEAPACNDGVDNDMDGLVDVRDADCDAPSDGSECGSGGMQSLAILPLLAYLGRRRRRASA